MPRPQRCEAKLTEVSTSEVRARQRTELRSDEARGLDELVRRAQTQAPREQWSHGHAQKVLEAAFRHVYERASVAREATVLSAALELHPDFYRWRDLRQALETHPEVLRKNGEMTLRAIYREEDVTIRRVLDSRNCYFKLGDAAALPATLTPGQRNAAEAILKSPDFMSVLIGDAGTGKTMVLTAIEDAHVAIGGERFIALAPTTRARDALVESGFERADTVQRFLVSEAMQRDVVRRVVLIDEAGLLSTQQLEHLTRITREVRARLILVGDTKRHYSVERGDALRNVIKHSHTPVVRLAEVLRQRNERDRRFSQLLGEGNVVEAFDYADRRGLIRETGDEASLFNRAAEHYVNNRAKGIGTIVVIPFWDEIERFNEHARPALRRAGLLGEMEVVREAVRPLSWTAEEKMHWERYQVGDRLLFGRDTRFFKRGVAAEVIAIDTAGVWVRGPNERETKITRRQRGAFEVGRAQSLAVAVGDRLLIRGRNDEAGFANGDFTEVAQVDSETNKIVFTDGRELPTDFSAWTYGHAVTSYRSQGTTSEESLLVLGDVASRALGRREFYVGNTRYRGAHAIYVSRKEAILSRLVDADTGRELATEFMARHRMALRMAPRYVQNARQRINIYAHTAQEAYRRAQRESQGQQMNP